MKNEKFKITKFLHFSIYNLNFTFFIDALYKEGGNRS